MGKVTGFMEFERVEEGYEPVPERVKNYKEFVIGLNDDEAKVQSARCMDCGIAVLQQRLPGQQHHSGLQRPGLPRRLEERVRRCCDSTNNFPEFTGRICPAPCEAACTLNINDDPVGIKSIEHAIIDRAWDERLGRAAAGRRARPARRSPWSAPARPAWPPRSSWRAPATT